MGYLVVTSGRILLPEPLEGQALAVLEVELGPLQGPFDADDLSVLGSPVESFADLAAVAGVRMVREAEWLSVSTDLEGEPTWSDQAAAFWTGLGRFATDGEIVVRGADGATWGYRYTGAGVERSGEPGSPPAGATPPVGASSGPSPAEPEAQGDAPDGPTPPAGPPATGGSVGWPPPVDPSEHPSSGAAAGTPPDGGYGAFFDDRAPAPRSPGRTAAMTALLVVGVLLIVAVAMLTAGIF